MFDPGLTPFWDGNQEFNSSGIRNFKTFQYSYPEFVGIPAEPSEASEFIWKKIEALYGPEVSTQISLFSDKCSL